jgi:MYXO-CTERM domain-containing protein
VRSPTLALIALAVCSVSVASSVTTDADAFLLLGKSKKAAHPATRAVVVREAERTLVAVQPRYVGPAETVALLVPVPKAAGGEPTTLSPDQVDRLDAISGPRLAEMWELDPCEIHIEQPDLDAPAPPREGPKDGAPAPPAPPESSWKKLPVEGKTGAEIVAALEKAGFVAPENTAAALDAYLGAGFGFVLATLDAPKGEGRGALLPPLRVEYDAKDFSLATRLAAIRGGHDFTAFILSPDGRFEATGQPNQGLPTNLDVVPATKDKVPVFSGHLADYVFAKKPEALVTEYAWGATTCEGCAAPLAAADLSAFGTGLLPSAKTGKQSEVLVEAGDVAAEPDGPADVRERLAACYGKALQAKAGLAGEVAVDVKTGAAGEVTSAEAKGDGDAALKACATESFKGAKLGKNGVSGTAKLTFSPMARDYLESYVLTRLHARFDKAPEKDVTLRRGSPLEGGRELGPELNEPAPAKAYASETTDNYQARYVVRHPWTGKMECSSPKRGVWGDKPVAKSDPAPSTSGSAAPSAGPATSAKAPKKKADNADKKDKGDEKAPEVVAWLASGAAPDLQPFAINLPAGTAKPPKPTPSAAPAPTPAPSASAPATTATPQPDSGCGCGVPVEHAPTGLGAALAAAVALFARRRRR